MVSGEAALQSLSCLFFLVSSWNYEDKETDSQILRQRETVIERWEERGGIKRKYSQNRAERSEGKGEEERRKEGRKRGQERLGGRKRRG